MTQKTKNFISRSIAIHGNIYDYSDSVYINIRTKVKIFCKEHNTTFSQRPDHHLNGNSGCKQCALVKSRKKCLEKYGFENPAQSILTKKKMKQTCLWRYGFENPHQNEKIKDKAIQTNLIKYGFENPFQVKQFKEKSKTTSLRKYGVEHPSQIGISSKSLNLLNDSTWLIEQHHNKKLPLSAIARQLKVSKTTISKYFKKHNIKVKYFFQSEGEKELTTFINSLGYEVKTNQCDIIPPYEIDIFIPKINIALEYNGLFWHKNLGTNYHKNKTELCVAQNIHLIHIWEDEWLYHKSKIKEDIIRILNRKPLQILNNYITINLAKENPQIYLDLGYIIKNTSIPEIYSDGIWDCGNMILKGI